MLSYFKHLYWKWKNIPTRTVEGGYMSRTAYYEVYRYTQLRFGNLLCLRKVTIEHTAVYFDCRCKMIKVNNSNTLLF
jgi:hypothetical protein